MNEQITRKKERERNHWCPHILQLAVYDIFDKYSTANT